MGILSEKRTLSANSAIPLILPFIIGLKRLWKKTWLRIREILRIEESVFSISRR